MPDVSFDNTFVHASKFLPPVALRSITSRSGLGVYASSDTLYKGAVFGRDSLEVAEDLMDTNRLLVRRILLTLARLQGEEWNDANEEEPGKIMHEYRRRIVDGRPIKGEQLRIFETLGAKWGGTGDELLYYGSIDATPQFVRTVGAYVERYGDKLLQQKVVLRSGNQTTFKIIVENAVTWLTRHLEQSKSGLVAYQRRNPEGIPNQVWKDSEEFYVHPDGAYANHQAPIASIEVQGLAYDALLAAAWLLPAHGGHYLELATALRDRVLELLWQPEAHYFALGTDFDDGGHLRVIQTKTANPAALLDTAFFDGVSHNAKERYVSGIVSTIMSDDFLTDAGVRSRALSARHLIPFKDYHGSYVTWPKETYDIAKGLRRQGFPELAHELENRLLNISLRNLAYPEFIYVDGRGRVLPARLKTHAHAHVTVINSTNKPEAVQAWTVSAILAILARRTRAKAQRANLAKHAVRQAKMLAGRHKLETPERERWQLTLEQHILADIPRVKRLVSPAALKARYPRYEFRIERP
jgi:glycogen debranching enzyme